MLICAGIEGGLSVSWRDLHGAVELMWILLVAVGRNGNRNESSWWHLFHERTLDAAP